MRDDWSFKLVGTSRRSPMMCPVTFTRKEASRSYGNLVAVQLDPIVFPSDALRIVERPRWPLKRLVGATRPSSAGA